MTDDRGRRGRQIAVAVGVLVVAGAVLGIGAGLVGRSLTGAVDVGKSQAPPPPRASIGPTETPTPTPTGAGSPSASATTPASPSATPTPTPTPSGITAQAPATAGRGQRIDISGVYAGAPAGVRLQVQRLQGGQWADFPASTRTDPGGTYSLWIKTSRRGEQQLRIIDKATGTASDPVTVRIG